MPEGLIRLLSDSSTFWCGALCIGSWALLSSQGVVIPLEAFMGLFGIYGIKEGARYVGDGLAVQRTPTAPE